MTEPRIGSTVTHVADRRSGEDRRHGERRRVDVSAAVDRRSGTDRRIRERRKQNRSAWRSRVAAKRRPAVFEEALTPIRTAAARVAAEWSDDFGDSVNVAEVSELLKAIVDALSGPLPTTSSVDPGLRSVLGRRLLELFRAGLVRYWAQGTALPAPHEMLEILGAVEALRAAIDPNWRQHFASRLSGPDGLALVVEVAHDLRSPLTSILFLAETLQRGHSGPVTELQHRQLGLVYSAALGLSELASNVIELARNGTRLAEDDAVPFSTVELMEAVGDIVRPMAEEKGLEVRLIPPTRDHRLGHPDALSRILLNLTTNALKFTEEGSVEIAAREKNMSRVEFSVRDTGRGIDPKARETLFLPFRRVVEGDGYHFSGTGLGLALCRRLVEVMGSELRVETRPDWGTRFYFDLELHPLNQQ
jgi:signal transduction histidine kinase